MKNPFQRSRRWGSPFHAGDVVQCVDARGTTLTVNARYTVAETSECVACGGGVRLTSGPRPTDRQCGWWEARRFRSPDAPTSLHRKRAASQPRHNTNTPSRKTPSREFEDA